MAPTRGLVQRRAVEVEEELWTEQEWPEQEWPEEEWPESSRPEAEDEGEEVSEEELQLEQELLPKLLRASSMEALLKVLQNALEVQKLRGPASSLPPRIIFLAVKKLARNRRDLSRDLVEKGIWQALALQLGKALVRRQPMQGGSAAGLLHDLSLLTNADKMQRFNGFTLQASSSTLLDSLVRILLFRASDLTNSELVLSLRACARMEKRTWPVTEELVEALAAIAAARANTLEAEDLGELIWTCGERKSSVALAEGLPAFSQVAVRLVPEMSPSALAFMCEGLASCNYRNAELLAEVLSAVKGVRTWAPEEQAARLPVIAMALLKLKVPMEDPAPFQAIFSSMVPVLHELTDWGVCATAWSLRQLQAGQYPKFRAMVDAELLNRKIGKQMIPMSIMGPKGFRQAKQMGRIQKF